MIRINLLGEDVAQDSHGFFQIIVFITSLIVLGATFFFLSAKNTREIAELEIRVTNSELQLKRLQKITKEVRDLEKKRKDLNSKLAVIATLKLSKTGPVRVLDDLNNAVPERAWVENLIEKGNVVKIEGKALDNQTIAAFLKRLEESDYFPVVKLIESKKASHNSVRIQSFVIEAQVSYAGQLEQRKKKAVRPSKKKA